MEITRSKGFSLYDGRNSRCIRFPMDLSTISNQYASKNDMTLAALFAGASIGVGLVLFSVMVVQPAGLILLQDLLINIWVGAWAKRCLSLMLVSSYFH